MLQSIRDHTQGWIAGVIISVLILSFALWGVSSYIGGNGNDSNIAEVNGVPITQAEHSASYERLRRQLQSQSKSMDQLTQQAEVDLKKRSLQTLINVQVLKQAAENQNYRVSPRQIDSFLESIPEFQVNGQFSTQRFQQMLEANLYTPGDFLQLIRTSLLIDQPRLGILFTSFALPNEVDNSIKLVNQERDIQYAVLSLDQFSKEPVQISQDEIVAYYNQNKAQFKVPEKASVEYVELSVKNIEAGSLPTDAALKTFYTENTNSFAQPMQWKLQSIILPLAKNSTEQQVVLAEKKMNEIVEKAGKGEDFTALAKQYSLKEANDKTKDWLTTNQMPAELRQEVVTLTKPGQVSHPIPTPEGLALVKVIAIKQPVIEPFEKVKDQVKNAYMRQLAVEKFAEMRDKLASVAYEHPDSLEPAAKALGLKINTTNTFSKEKGDGDITVNPKVREAAFSNDVINLNNSDVIQLTADSAVVIRIKTHTPATFMPLSAVEKQITDKIRVAEIESKAEKLANEIKAKLRNGSTPEQIAQQYHVSWNSVGFVGRHGSKVDSAVMETAFAMPQDGKKMNYATAKVPTGYAIVILKGIREGVAASTNNQDQYKVFAEQYQNAEGLMEYELYKQSLMKEAKISVGS